MVNYFSYNTNEGYRQSVTLGFKSDTKCSPVFSFREAETEYRAALCVTIEK